MFKTLEEANEWKVEQEKKYNELKTAHEGLQTKLADTEKIVTERDSEIDRLKIKNYEFLEQIAVNQSNTPPPVDGGNTEPTDFDFDGFMKEI